MVNKNFTTYPDRMSSTGDNEDFTTPNKINNFNIVKHGDKGGLMYSFSTNEGVFCGNVVPTINKLLDESAQGSCPTITISSNIARRVEDVNIANNVDGTNFHLITKKVREPISSDSNSNSSSSSSSSSSSRDVSFVTDSEGKTLYFYNDVVAASASRQEGASKARREPLISTVIQRDSVIKNALWERTGPDSRTVIIVNQDKVIAYYDRIQEVSTEKTKIEAIQTYDNPLGLCVTGVKPETKSLFIITLGLNKGQIQVIEKVNDNSDQKYQTKSIKMINAHKSDIKNIAVSDNLNWLATSSENSTLIRVYDISGSEAFFKCELRRGSTTAEIHSISFSKGNKALACTSSNGTVHVFDLNENTAETKNVGSFFRPLHSVMSYVIDANYLDSKWSYAAHQNLTSNGCKMICKFDKHLNVLHVFTFDGGYYCVYGEEYNHITSKYSIPINYKEYSRHSAMRTDIPCQ